MFDNINRVAAIAHTTSSVVAASIIREPFPYVLLENVFDENLYDALLQLVRLDELFYAEEGGSGYTIFRFPKATPHLSSGISAFVEFMAQEFTPRLFNALRDKFSDSLLEWAEHLRVRGLYQKSVDAMITTEIKTEMHPYESGYSLHDGMTCQFEIMRRTRDFSISPHCHPVRELLIGLFPITPDDALEDYGTELFAVKEGCAPPLDTNIFSYVPHEIVKRVGRTKFRRNSGFVMLNTAGVHAYNPPPTPRPRDYLYVTLLIGDRALASAPIKLANADPGGSAKS
jgi:hypothetical protein